MLEIKICDVDFKNPVITASGTFGFGMEYGEFYDISRLGGICSKGLTLNPKEGNDGIRIYESKSGIMNSVGLQNPGVRAFIERELPKMKSFDTNIIANVGGSQVEDYIESIELLNNQDLDFIELNISCPNVKHGGMALGIKSDVAYKAVSEIRRHCNKKLIVKLSPNAENIVDMAVKCEEAGADALSLVNTFQAMAIDVRRRKAVFENTYAGLSGQAIKPIALRMVHQVAKNVSVPVIGMGGIVTAEDAIEFMMAGASAIQVGTGNFMDYKAPINIIDGLEKFMEAQGIKDIKDIIGII